MLAGQAGTHRLYAAKAPRLSTTSDELSRTSAGSSLENVSAVAAAATEAAACGTHNDQTTTVAHLTDCRECQQTANTISSIP